MSGRKSYDDDVDDDDDDDDDDIYELEMLTFLSLCSKNTVVDLH